MNKRRQEERLKIERKMAFLTFVSSQGLAGSTEHIVGVQLRSVGC